MPHDYIISDGELYHYGVRGMKWGVRRYQDKNGRLTAAGRARLKDRKVNKKIEDYVKAGKAYVDGSGNYEVGLSTMTTHLGEKIVSGLVSGHDFDWSERINIGTEENPSWESPALALKEAERLGFDLWQTDPADDIIHSKGAISDADLAMCNPGFGTRGTTDNCVPCSATLELRRRGINVSARRMSTGSHSDALEFWFDGAKRVEYDYASAEDALRSYGPMTSGTLDFKYPGGRSGHAVHWTNNANGFFEVQCGQSNKRFGSISAMMRAFGGDTTSPIATYRLDNCPPNWDNIASDGVIRVTEDTLGYDDYDNNLKVKNRIDGRVVDTW